jgi:hypothetical protein
MWVSSDCPMKSSTVLAYGEDILVMGSPTDVEAFAES